ncbi:hypothetical protein [Thermococcus sp.]
MALVNVNGEEKRVLITNTSRLQEFMIPSRKHSAYQKPAERQTSS